MTLSVDLWIPWATRLPGVLDKVYAERNSGRGLIGHSIVGSWPSALSRFLSRDRDSVGRYTPNAAASVMFGALKSGELIEMYSTLASTWTSGGREANTSFWSIEAEGGAPGNESEPLTALQVDTLLKLCAEWIELTGGSIIKGETFVEHGAIAMKYGYAPTACPSNRYQLFYEALEGDTMTPTERAEMDALKLVVARIDKGIALGPDGQGYDILNSSLNEELTKHINEHPGPSKFKAEIKVI